MCRFAFERTPNALQQPGNEHPQATTTLGTVQKNRNGAYLRLTPLWLFMCVRRPLGLHWSQSLCMHDGSLTHRGNTWPHWSHLCIRGVLVGPSAGAVVDAGRGGRDGDLGGSGRRPYSCVATSPDGEKVVCERNRPEVDSSDSDGCVCRLEGRWA